MYFSKVCYSLGLYSFISNYKPLTFLLIIGFAMHLNIDYVEMYNKIYIRRKAKPTYKLK